MYKLVLLALAVTAANAGILSHGYGVAPAAYAGYGHAVAPLGHAVAPLGYAHGYGHAAVAPVAHATAVHVAPAAHAYALPPVQTIQNAPVVSTVVEPVEQWGYKVAY
jgi:hypothetical protein